MPSCPQFTVAGAIATGTHGSGLHIQNLAADASMLEFMLRESEQLGGKIRRYTSPDEHAFYPESLPLLVIGAMQYENPLAPAADSHCAKVGTTPDPANGIIGVEDGRKAGRACALTMLSVLRNQLGSLNHLKRLVNAKGFVNSTPEFTGQPEVMNAFSETMVELFGERGKATRSAVGVAALPRGWAVEVEAVFELQDELVAKTKKR